MNASLSTSKLRRINIFFDYEHSVHLLSWHNRRIRIGSFSNLNTRAFFTTTPTGGSTQKDDFETHTTTTTTTTRPSIELVSRENDDDRLDLRNDSLTKPSMMDSMFRLMELSKQEWSLIALSASTLAITSSVTLLMPYASGAVIDYTVQAAAATSSTVGGESDSLSPMVLAGGLFGLNAFAAGGVYLRTLWLARAGNRIVARLKQRLYGSLLRQDSAWLDQQTTGDLLSRLTADAQMVQSAVTTQAIAGLRGLVMSVGSIGMLVYTSPLLAAISCGTLPPIFILSRHYGRQLSKQQEHVQALLGDATTLAEQSLSAVSTVKQFVAEDFETNRYRNSIADAHQKAVDTSHMQAKLEAGAHISGNAAVLCVLGYGGSMVVSGVEGSITAGDLTGFVMYSFLLAGNLSSLTSVYSDMVRAIAASDRILSILDRVPKIPALSTLALEKEQNANPLEYVHYHQSMKKHDSVLNARALDVAKDSEVANVVQAPLIELQDLNFQYPARSDVAVLRNFTLTVNPGEIVALVGGSGSGKSTVARLLTRLYDPAQKSSIRLDGKNLADYDLNEVRRLIGIVSQEPTLFAGTIRDNIRYGEWENVSEDDVVMAARQANVLDFALQFPDGLDTMVGPRGMQLSGGQRQRIALARVLAKNSPVIVLDEATSALDAQSEHLVQKTLEKLFEENSGRTILSIAHRLSTIRRASRIAVVENGTIVQSGTFDGLRSNDGPFRDLMRTQLVGDI